VRESARGRGVGGALMNELLRRLPFQGCAEVSVTTMPDNVRAQRIIQLRDDPKSRNRRDAAWPVMRLDCRQLIGHKRSRSV